MPTVKIYGPKSIVLMMAMMNNSIIKAIEDIPELGLKGKDWVKIIYPAHNSNNDTVVVEITLLANPARTLEVRNRLAEIVCREIQKFCPSQKIQCSIFSLTENQGSYSLDPIP